MKTTLRNPFFQAEVIPEIGGNVISLRHLKSHTKLLREPLDISDLRRFPEQYGLPVLFPPNRIDKGQFRFEGMDCHLPVNEVAMQNHLHGLVVGKEWSLTALDDSSAEMQYTFSESCPEYEGFPFAFRLTRKVRLTESGLQDDMIVNNLGTRNMPLGLGYHSTFPSVGAKVRLGTGKYQIGIGERYLPTGSELAWNDFDPRIFFDPNGRNIGFHARAGNLIKENGTHLHGAEILYSTGVLRYITDEKFGFWYTWNRRGQGDFISLEPVSWMANALNIHEPPEKTGVLVLAPGANILFHNELQFEAKE